MDGSSGSLLALRSRRNPSSAASKLPPAGVGPRGETRQGEIESHPGQNAFDTASTSPGPCVWAGTPRPASMPSDRVCAVTVATLVCCRSLTRPAWMALRLSAIALQPKPRGDTGGKLCAEAAPRNRTGPAGVAIRPSQPVRQDGDAPPNASGRIRTCNLLHLKQAILPIDLRTRNVPRGIRTPTARGLSPPHLPVVLSGRMTPGGLEPPPLGPEPSASAN